MRCMNEGTEAPRGQKGRLTKCGDEVRFRRSLVTHGEAAFSGPRGAQILSREEGEVPC